MASKNHKYTKKLLSHSNKKFSAYLLPILHVFIEPSNTYVFPNWINTGPNAKYQKWFYLGTGCIIKIPNQIVESSKSYGGKIERRDN